MVEIVGERTRRRRSTARWIACGLGVSAIAASVGLTAVGGLSGAPRANASSPRPTVVSSGNYLVGRSHAGPGTPAGATAPGAPDAKAPVEPSTPAVAPPPAAASPAVPVVTTTTPPAAPASPAASPPATVPALADGADVAALVSQVEAAGIAPGTTWTWSAGDTSACGAIPGTNVGTGCTSGAAGSVTTVFAGAPGLLLVAHEIANAETENYAVPDLVALVARDAGGTSWSPIDAVASCLVVHFLRVQDGAAGSWACPVGLADVVAAHIHDATFTG
jgi:hypothetical protein